MAEQDIAAPDADASRSYLATKHHCVGCLKMAIKTDDLGNFIIAFWDKFDPKTGEPIIRDGIFDENQRIAILKACPDCGAKIKALHKGYSYAKMNQLAPLNDGPLKKMLLEIWPRRKSAWRLEIGWEILLPILQQTKATKMSKQKAIRAEDEAVDRLGWTGRKLH